MEDVGDTPVGIRPLEDLSGVVTSLPVGDSRATERRSSVEED